MLATHPTQPRGRATISWTARVIGLAASLLWVFTMIGHLVEEGFAPLEAEGLMLGSFILIAMTGVFTAFFNEDTGGSIALVAGIALSVFAALSAGRNHWLAILVTGAPFVVSGALFLISARMARNGASN